MYKIIAILMGFVIGFFIGGMFITGTGVFAEPAYNVLVISFCLFIIAMTAIAEVAESK